VMYSEFITHRMPELYPQPARFDPHRWLGPEPSPFAYIPFLAGPRRCLGAEFAMLEMKIVLAMVLQRFRLEIPPNTRVDRAVVFTLLPKYGLPMRVLPQDRLFHSTPVRGNIHELVDLAK
jgi:cytochrome P450